MHDQPYVSNWEQVETHVEQGWVHHQMDGMEHNFAVAGEKVSDRMWHKTVAVEEVSDECAKSAVLHDVQLGFLEGQPGIDGQAKEHGAKPFQQFNY